jgi:hypothetical protein
MSIARDTLFYDSSSKSMKQQRSEHHHYHPSYARNCRSQTLGSRCVRVSLFLGRLSTEKSFHSCHNKGVKGAAENWRRLLWKSLCGRRLENKNCINPRTFLAATLSRVPALGFVAVRVLHRHSNHHAAALGLPARIQLLISSYHPARNTGCGAAPTLGLAATSGIF